MTSLEKNRHFVIMIETGFCQEMEIIEGFQRLINTKALKHLPDKFIQAATRLIETGYCTRGGE